MELQTIRKDIDEIDRQIVDLFSKRMQECGKVADYKKEHHLNVTDQGRERAKLNDVLAMAPPEFKKDLFSLYSLIFDLSKAYQTRLIGGESELGTRIRKALDETEKEFPDFPVVACQGVEGANSQIACERLFTSPTILYFKSFDAVFSAIEQGLCRYGILPIENSTAGSVNQVYDLMMRHKFSIVRSVRLKVGHCLLAKPGTKLGDIREIFSHDQAISQCSEFLGALKDVKVTVCGNTAVAARMVAESDRNDIAAISSFNCCEIYGLECLKEGIQDNDNNFTRFICISKNLEIFPGADRTSIMAVTEHKPGALYKLLSHFYALGMNLTKLESRPLPDRNFEFMFYFDLEKSVYAPDFVQTIVDISRTCERFEYLGSYSEVV